MYVPTFAKNCCVPLLPECLDYSLIAFVQMSYFAGIVVSEAVNWILKHTIKEYRPLRSMYHTQLSSMF